MEAMVQQAKPAPSPDTNPDVSDNDHLSPHAAVAHTLQVRNDLLVNTYLVACGVFFATFALTGLDMYSLALFACALGVLATRDFVFRLATPPDCFDPALAPTVQRVTRVMEAAVLLLLAAVTALIFYTSQNASGVQAPFGS
eukprot:2894893-Rhodomonas_salina.1